MLDEEPTVPSSGRPRRGPRALKKPVPWHYPEMGRLVADAGKRDWDELTPEHGTMHAEGLRVMGCPKKHRFSEDKAYRR